MSLKGRLAEKQPGSGCMKATIMRTVTRDGYMGNRPHMPYTHSGIDIFLHGSRRYVCRRCTSHLSLVNERDTNPAATPEQTKNPKPKPTQQTTTTKKGAGFVPLVGCVSQCKKVKRSETGAMNSSFTLSTTRSGWQVFPKGSSEMGTHL